MTGQDITERGATMRIDSSDALFDILKHRGRLYVHQATDGTWSARLEVPTSIASMKAELHSGFKHPSPQAALRILVDLSEQVPQQNVTVTVRK